MNRLRKKQLKKNVVSRTKLGLASVLSVQTLGLCIVPALTNNVEKELKAESVTHVVGKKTGNDDGVNIALNQELNDNGDGTYTLKLKTGTSLEYKDFSVKKTRVKNGYFEAPQDGDYMLEVYGGSGANGQNTIYSYGGKGGAGAHLYSVITLKKGEILCYTIGGNGQQTLSNDSGGGANGDGGDHGDTGSYYVGGGGGYSAVYLFKDGNEFKSKYLVNGEVELKDFESDRKTKYVMIAGGGGGGGAGNAFSLTDKAIRTPDGGIGGDFSMGGVSISTPAYAVAGTYYPGHDGYSSGKRQDYIGKGGTSIPGAVNETFLEFFNGKNPNDWTGKPNTKYPGGSGGSGNLRGGAGGAGFAGGSGGIMTGLLVGTNVGGGGGGSSFISSELKAPTGDQLSYLANNNDSTTGGAVYITYMPTTSTFEYLQNINLETKISKYFKVLNSTTDHGTVEVVDNIVKAKDIVATPTISEEQGVSTTITLTVKPVDGFMGGNDVNIFDDDIVSYSYQKNLTSHIFEMEVSQNCSYVNVPYAFNLETYSFTRSADEDGNYTLNVSDLFKNENYASSYDFIENVSGYKVELNSEEIKTDTVEITIPDDKSSITKTFFVSFGVTPKASTGKAIVGEKLTQKTYLKTAKVTLIKAAKNELNGHEMVYKKTLDYDPKDGTYNFAINVSTSIDKYADNLQIKEKFEYETVGESAQYIVDSEGDYYIQAWGGKGGMGGLSARTASGRKYNGADGGNSGYLGYAVHLLKDDVVSITIGKNGVNGQNSSTETWSGQRGEGGKGSIVRIIRNGVEQTLFAAAGSGGGGGGVWLGSPSTGSSVGTSFTNNISNINGNSLSSYSGFHIALDESDGGSAGNNYRSTSALETFKASSKAHIVEGAFGSQDFSVKSNTDDAVYGGAVYISSLPTEQDPLSGYGVKADFTNDFVVNEVTVEGGSATITGNEVSNITPTPVTSGDLLNFDFTVKYNLSPSPDCIGGVDIKLLEGLKITQVDCDDHLGNEEIVVSPQNETDYANVRLNNSLLDGFDLETQSIDYIQGGEGFDTSTLYTCTLGSYDDELFTIKEPEHSVQNPNNTTDYSFSYGLENKKEPQLAVVGPVDPLLITEYARVTVHHTLTYETVGVNIDAEVENINGADYYTFIPGQDYQAYLTPSTGMVFDDDNPFVVRINGEKSVGYTYDIVTGLLTIPGEELKADSVVVISGEAAKKKFTLHYLVSIDVEGYSTQEFTYQLEAGVSGSDFTDAYNALINDNYPVSDATEYPGYVYTIEHPVDENGNLFTEMPAFDLWINGCYHPNPHSLTINYVDELGNVLGTKYEDSAETCYNKKDIDITSPEITGYAPLKVTTGEFPGSDTSYNAGRVQFVMPDEDVTLNVVYQSTARSVVVTYVSPVNVELPKTRDELTGEVGTEYSITPPAVPGFEPDVEVVTGSFSENGESIVVTYTPKAYKISFKESLEAEASTLFEDRNVFYGEELGFTGSTYEDVSFIPLPTPSKEGYKFKGWLMNGFFVDGLTVFNLNNDVTLIPVFEQVIFPVDEKDCTVVFEPGFYTYNGTNQEEPVVRVFIDQTELNSGTDFKATFPTDLKNVGEKDVKITFKGKYTGEIHATFEIKPKDAESSISVADVEGTFVYNGNEFKPTPEVKDGDILLTSKDFEYTYENNIQAGTATVTVNFKGNYAATDPISKTFTISPKEISGGETNITVSGITDPVTFNESAFEPEVSVVYHDGDVDKTLVLGKDYIVTYGENTNAGEGTVTITFINNYAGTPDIEKTFTINPITMTEELTITGIDPNGYTFTGLEIEPELTVVYGGKTLTQNFDYRVHYFDNVHVNSDSNVPTAVVTFIGNYFGDPVTLTFDILPKKVSNPENNLDITPQEYPTNPIVKDGDYELRSPEDFEITYDGEGHGTITFKGDYEGTEPIKFDVVVKTIKISDLSISGPEDKTFTGSAIEPTDVVIKYGDYTLINQIDYLLTYGENIHAGTGAGSVIITLKGGFKAENNETKTVYFNILSKAVEDPETNFEVEPKPYPQNPIIKDGDNELRCPEDFEVNYDGEGHGEITFKGDYEGTEPIEFDIIQTEIDLNELYVAGPKDCVFTGEQIKPEDVIVIYNGKTLKNNLDYTLSYGENVHAGDNAGEVNITLIIGYKSKTGEDKKVYFNILPKTVENPKDNLDVTPQEYPQNPIIKDGDNELRCPEDFEVNYDGEGHGEIIFKGDYEGTESITFDVVQTEIDIESLTIEGPEDYVFTGLQIKPEDIVIHFNEYELIAGLDYELSYGENIHAGEDAGEVIITLIGGFKAENDETKSVYFDILPKVVSDPDTNISVEPQEYPTAPIIKDGDNELRCPEDFEVNYDGEGHGEVVFKGDYEGTEPITFDVVVNEIDISELSVIGPQDYTFTGLQIKPEDIVVSYGEQLLTNNIDYKLSYGENVHAGEDAGEVIITLIGGFKAENDETKSVYFDILPKVVSDPDTNISVEPQEYPTAPIIKDGDNELRCPEDFEVNYDGEGHGEIIFKGDYEGTESITFDVVVNEISIDELLTTGPKAVTYDGKQQKPIDIVVNYNGYTLIKDVDYTLEYGENIHSGKNSGEVYINLIGGFKAENNEVKTLYFDINPRSLNNDGLNITPNGDEENPIEIPNTGDKPDPRPITITDKETGEELEEGKDYEVIIDEENGEIIIKFEGDYEGTDDLVEKFEKVPGDATENLDIEDIPDQPFDENGNEPKPVITDKEGNALEEGKDYELEYGEDEDGNPEVIVHFKDLFEETPDMHIPFNIIPKDLGDDAVITFETESAPFDGEAVMPNVIVKDGDKVLEKGKDYVVHYTDNTSPGVGKAIVEFIGNYANTEIKTCEFNIKAVSLDNRSNAEGKATVIVKYDEGFEPDISLTAELRETVLDEMKDQAKLGGRFYGTYGDYEIKLLDKDGNEVQPSDIKEGSVLTLMIELPKELQGRDVKLVHYHSADDISLIVKGDEAGIGTYVITEEGYIMTLVNKFSDFSIIYEETCIAHWFLITAAILDILLLAAIVVMGKKQSKALGIGAIVGLAVITGVGAIFAHCTLCYVMLGINGLLVLFNILFFALWKGKEEASAQPQVIYMQAPAVQPQAVAAQAPVANQSEALTLKESMAQASLVNATQSSINKLAIANWLSKTYGEKVEVNHRENLTSTGLPLADTHYIDINGERKCFAYVYEVNGKCFLLVRSDESTVSKVKSHNHIVIPSAFPKTRDYAKWFTLLIDNSYANDESFYATLKFMISRLGVAEAVKPVEQAPAKEEAPVAPVVEEVKADLSLKESISEAKVSVSEVKMNKAIIAKFLSETYGEKVVVNTRENMTSTGLPLADTHYIYFGENKKCFIYVYDVDGSCFCILRSDEETAKEVKAMGHKFVSSAFPKTRDYAKWFTMLFDSSYKSNEEALASIKHVVDKLLGEKGEPAPLKEEAPVAPVVEEEVKADLSLKESISEAKVSVSELKMDKAVIAKFLSETYGDKVIVNTRDNMTSTGLPLADTHYIYLGENKKCFIYVYDVDGSCFCILRSDEETAKEVKSLGHKFVSSAFPKTRDYAKWFTMLFDKSYKSNEDALATIKLVVDRLLGEKGGSTPVVEEKPVVEEVKEDLSLKESMAEAKESVNSLSINKEAVAKYLSAKYGKKVVVNTRENMTSTGLPLADTHYLYIGEDKKCFIYIYDVEGKVFFIVRGNDEIAKEVKALKHKFVTSAFPKTRDYAHWYTMIIDDSYKSNDEVFKALDVVVEGLLGGVSKEEAPVVEEEPANDLSLKESIAKAAEVKANIPMNKENIAKWLKETYGDKVVVNVRECMTSTGLPLADTHYIEKDGIKKCFIYIYELNGNCFAIVRSDEETAKEVRKGKHKFISSAFPKTRDYAKWYTMLFDDSYASSSEVFETLAKVIDNIKLK